MQNRLTQAQHETLMKPLNATRVAKRSQSGKQLSYLESWDVRAHLIRVFGFGNFDVVLVDQNLVGVREYEAKTGKTAMVEVSWFAKVMLTVRAEDGTTLCSYSDASVGSTAGPATMIGEHHDNAIKTAASDALKRCAMNLGTQFGLSLYDNGRTTDVVKGTLVKPDGVVTAPTDQEKENATAAEALLASSLGATRVETEGATA